MILDRLVLALLGTLLVGCQTSRNTSRCVLVASGGGPVLSLAAANPVAEPVRVKPDHVSPVRCEGIVLGAPVGPPPFFVDDPVDDLTAITRGVALVAGQTRTVCPKLSSTEEPAGNAERPCGGYACPNRQIRVDGNGVLVHVVFYDDPGLRRQDRAMESPSGACYYRVLAMSVSWEGEAPQ